jgi:hypothetical protein
MGLTIARINTAFSGNANRSWTYPNPYQDEAYVYRPGETGINDAKGTPGNASLASHSSSPRTSFGAASGEGYNGYIYLFGGSNTSYMISNVSEADETISFDIRACLVSRLRWRFERIFRQARRCARRIIASVMQARGDEAWRKIGRNDAVMGTLNRL